MIIKENVYLEIVKKVILIINLVREFENTKDESLIFTSQYYQKIFGVRVSYYRLKIRVCNPYVFCSNDLYQSVLTFLSCREDFF